jgi:hypothetical protein
VANYRDRVHKRAVPDRDRTVFRFWPPPGVRFWPMSDLTRAKPRRLLLGEELTNSAAPDEDPGLDRG